MPPNALQLASPRLTAKHLFQKVGCAQAAFSVQVLHHFIQHNQIAATSNDRPGERRLKLKHRVD
jgi:hypothetical protein